jgi:hypothetical protein
MPNGAKSMHRPIRIEIPPARRDYPVQVIHMKINSNPGGSWDSLLLNPTVVSVSN